MGYLLLLIEYWFVVICGLGVYWGGILVWGWYLFGDLGGDLVLFWMLGLGFGFLGVVGYVL